MKILIYGLNYAPELTGIGKYTAEMAETLVRFGHDVRVVCAPPYYPEWQVAQGYSAWRYRCEVVRGVQLWRAPLWVPHKPGGVARMLHLATFALASLPLVLRQAFWRPDVVMAIAPTLMCAPAAALLARLTGAKSWLHVQDFEVDAAFNLGLLKRASAARIAHALERALLHRFDVVSSISDKMVERARRLGVDAAKVFSLPNWVDTSVIYPLGRASDYRRELDIPAGDKVVLYSGNMGSKQGIELLAQAAARLVERADIRFVFCGNGATKADLMRRCEGLPNCRFMPLQPAERLNELLNLADIHVLPQRGDAADLVMPSKLTGMLASGGAIIAMARPETELYAVVAERGVVVEPENVEALVGAITGLADDPLRRAMLGEAARRFAEESLAPAAVLGRFDVRLGQLLRNAGAKGHAVRPGA
ncbi:colanic acid biosynthesis glycosyltransferase WcaI [Trinickia violacea]|uniref:Colanic acid biosynthesis glycosyltransferase WcaI n=1 Tax=Trinickia violacea TaxID=2571746 RepID=A0A4P8IUU2_9BURK|nr:glycosyltransferase WbuB [Trinickia violacea]QCP50874.1 colanic acid biosynthesis glycosyltransferase WcaI [Trinickia violacea]